MRPNFKVIPPKISLKLPYKIIKNENETNLFNLPLRNIPNNAKKLFIISTITQDNTTDLPENAENLKYNDFRHILSILYLL